MPIPVDGRKGALTRLPVSDRDTTAADSPTDNIPEPGVVRQDAWMDERDSVIWWRIDVPEQGIYDFSVQYACDSSLAGGMLVLVTDGSETKITLAEPSQNNRSASTGPEPVRRNKREELEIR